MASWLTASLQGQVGEAMDDDSDKRGMARPCGYVVGIIKRGWRQRGYAGSLLPPRDGAKPPVDGRPASVLFCPVERCFPCIRIVTRQARPDAASLVRLLPW